MQSKSYQWLLLGGTGIFIGASLMAVKNYVTGSSSEEREPEIKSSFNPSGVTVGIEIGGTGYKLAAYKPEDLSGLQKGKTPQPFAMDLYETKTPDETVENMARWIQETAPEVEAVGIASFGPLVLEKRAKSYGSIAETPKPHWRQYPLLQQLSEKLKGKLGRDVRVSIQTDVNACALLQYYYGDHKAVTENVAYVTVGTGIGVGLVVNGKVVHGLTHPEGGHISVHKHPDDSQFIGVCPFHINCLEGLARTGAVAKRKWMQVDDLQKLKDDDHAWDIEAYYLAQLALNLTLTVSPQAIVFGGGILKRNLLLQKVRTQFSKLLNGYVKHPKLEEQNYIVLSKFGSKNGVLAASILTQS